MITIKQRKHYQKKRHKRKTFCFISYLISLSILNISFISFFGFLSEIAKKNERMNTAESPSLFGSLLSYTCLRSITWHRKNM